MSPPSGPALGGGEAGRGKEGPDTRHRFHLCLGRYKFVYSPARAYWKTGLSERSLRKGDSHTENRSVDHNTPRSSAPSTFKWPLPCRTCLLQTYLKVIFINIYNIDKDKEITNARCQLTWPSLEKTAMSESRCVFVKVS